MTAPGFGEIDPDNVTEEPRITELGDAAKVMVVGGRLKLAVNDPNPDDTTIVVGLLVEEETEMEPEVDHEENW
jgi:hypothetical protein